jgi:hypothetical protein
LCECDFVILKIHGLGDDGTVQLFDADKRLAVISDAREREEEQRRPQTDRRHRDVSDAGAAIAVQSSDEQAEYQVRDRLSFTRFLRLGFEDSISDARRYGCSVRRWQRLA